MSKKKKKRGFRLILLSLLFLPALEVLFIIGCNSDYLIRRPYLFIIAALIVIFTILLIRGVLLYTKNKKASRRKLRKWLKVVLGFIITVYILGCSIFVGILYGPSEKFKSWLITTAMRTMNHQYLCKWFYSEDDIQEVLNRNFVKESGASTDKSLITKKKRKTYIDEYDKEILDVEDGRKYKIIELEVDGQKAYLAAIYDPSMISLQVTKYLGKKGQYVTQMAEDTNAILAINGGGFREDGQLTLGGAPNGITIKDHKVLSNGEYGTSAGGIIGFTDDGILMLLKNKTAEEALELGIRDAVSWGPFLIVNGESSQVGGSGGWGFGARTAIGQREDGIVLFLVVDSNAQRTRGADMADLLEIMERYHAVNAANLDGGTSSVMALPKTGGLYDDDPMPVCQETADNVARYACPINDPIDSTWKHRSRYIADAWVVVDNGGGFNVDSNDTTGKEEKTTKTEKKQSSTKKSTKKGKN